MKLFFTIGFLLYFSIVIKNTSYAVILDVLNVPLSIQKEEEFEVLVSISGAKSSSTNYLRGAFHKEGLTSYFGYTLNHDNAWYNGSPIDPKKFLQIQIDSEGNWSGNLKVKPDNQNSAFKGNGNYFFKVGRYTENASSVSDWSEGKEISLIGNDETPSTTPTPTNVPSPTRSASPTKTPTPIRLVSLSSTRTPTPYLSIQPTSNSGFKNISPTSELVSHFSTKSGQANRKSSVLGMEKINKESKKVPQKIINEQNKTSNHELPIFGGVLFLCSACGILIFRKYKQDREMEI